MSNLHRMVTVVNRTSKELKGTFNGRPYDIPPGESRFSEQEAMFFRYQNPVMGRGTPLEDWNTKSEYLIGIKELGDDCSPIEQTDSPQRWDTDQVNGTGRWDVVRSRASYEPAATKRSPQTPDLSGSFFNKK